MIKITYPGSIDDNVYFDATSDFASLVRAIRADRPDEPVHVRCVGGMGVWIQRNVIARRWGDLPLQ